MINVLLLFYRKRKCVTLNLTAILNTQGTTIYKHPTVYTKQKKKEERYHFGDVAFLSSR